MSHIFISYSHKDTAYVEKLEKKLIGEGFDVWVDHRIDYGSRWTKEIEKAIDTCDAYVVVMSKNSAESQWVERERIHAERRRKPFFPLLLDGESWFSLGNIQFVDVRGGKLPPKDYYEDIGRFVARKADATSVGAGVSPVSTQPKKKLPLWGIVAIVVGFLALLGFALKGIFSKPDTGLDGTPMYATPIDQDSLHNTVEPTSEPEESSLIPPADAQLGDTWTRPNDRMLMSYIPAGEFQMGSEDGDDDEKPAHRVYLDAFWMDQTEITNAMFAACVSNGRCDNPNDTTHLYDPDYADHPVANIHWYDAVGYCERIGARLPTEAEWEKAAQGGLVGKKYPWGDEDPVCNLGAVNGAKFDDNIKCDGSGTEPIASFSANAYGLYDMVGNVWEWTSDRYAEDYYSLSPTQNPMGPDIGEYRVVRGGSWINLRADLGSAVRNQVEPGKSYSSLGFRCARSVSE